MSSTDRRSISIIVALACLAVATVSGQNGGVNWNAGNAAGAGAWSNGQGGGGVPGGVNMHPPGSLDSTDPRYSYGYAGVDSRGPYGGAGGNGGGYYVSGTDEHGRPYAYNGGNAGARPGYPNNYGYDRSSASAVIASMGLALALAMLSTRT